MPPLSVTNKVDPVVATGTGALVTSAIIQYYSTTESSFYSELLCWAALSTLPVHSLSPHLSRFHLPQHVDHQQASVPLQWTAAVFLGAYRLLMAEAGTWIVVQPFSTLLLLILQKSLGSESAPETIFSFAFLAKTVLDWTIHGHAFAAIGALCVLTITLILVTLHRSKRTDNSTIFGIESTATQIPICVLAVLLVILAFKGLSFGLPGIQPVRTLLLGFVKALFWKCILNTVRCDSSHEFPGEDKMQSRHTSWHVATLIGTFGIVTTSNPFAQSSDVVASSYLIASFATLGQVISILPERTKAKHMIWILFSISFVPYTANMFAIRKQLSSATAVHDHLVEGLIHNARTSFEQMLLKQSHNYTAAFDEYHHRYGTHPPPGFNSWFTFATQHHSPIIDEFDALNKQIAPFRRMSGKQLSAIMNDVYNAPGSDLWLCESRGAGVDVRCSHPYRTFDRHIQEHFRDLLGDLVGVLPNISLLVNHLDEPRVILPDRTSATDDDDYGSFKLTDLSRQPTWKALTKLCPPHTIEQITGYDGNMSSVADLNFVSNLSQTMNLCQHSEYQTMHGLALSPMSLPLIEGSVPVLSTGSLSTLDDILYPSPAYGEPEFQYVEEHDYHWEAKRDGLYWAGSTTGGFARDSNWRHFHRQRFVSLAQGLATQQYLYLDAATGGSGTKITASTFLNRRLFDVSFTSVRQCLSPQCRDQHSHFDIRPRAHKDAALRSRLVFDVDGNGISGRFYKLLASKSCPLKQTILQEWHDDRLMPWVHYVPVSLGMEELPELVRYLTLNEEGRRSARRIAMQGRDWYRKAFRKEDRAIYLYRLLLEMSWLLDPERPAS